MTTILFRRAAIAIAAIFLFAPGRASAQVLFNLGGPPYYGNDNVQAYFASDGDSVHLTDPVGLPSWGSAGSGPYGGYAVPSVPSPPATALYPSVLSPSTPFPQMSTFNDGGLPIPTTATSIIASGPVGGTSVASAYVQAVFSADEPLNPPNYAYEQLDFAQDFGTAGVLAGGLAGAPHFYVSGTTTGLGSYAQFSGVMNYYWIASTSSFVPLTGHVWTYLGSVDYDATHTGAGTFSGNVGPIGGSLIATPNSPGVLEVSGDFFVAGDPADFDVAPVPEPSAWLLFGIGLVGLVCWSVWRRPAMAV